ncbi:hypothetical protein KJ980_03265 [Patescibacteria group bacterium]|nr:hypothetical protein [Patescibacteria group bacterium]MBU4016045.1 hypothetical protein [Patescibacteria group bacterium]MBU4098646.1 hypothetical protein [Patescibacteria group bacterium]
MDNIEKKLTGIVGKSYHGGMTENCDELERKAKTPKELIKDGKIPVVKSVENKNAGVGPVDERVQEKKTGDQPVDLNDTTREQREEFAKVKKALEGERDGEKEPGLFDILMDLLRALFGDTKSEGELNKMIENSEAMRGLQAFWRVKPQNKWDAKDYARVLFMLAPDTSDASKTIQTNLKSVVKEKKIEQEVSNEGGKIRDKHKESFLKRDEDRSEPEKKAEVIHRAVAMNGELWLDTAKEEKLLDLSEEDLIRFEGAIETLIPQGEYEAQDQKAKEYLLRHSKDARRIRKIKEGMLSTSGGNDENEEKPKSSLETIEERLREIEKHGGKISENTSNMFLQLQEVNKRLSDISGVLIAGFGGDQDVIRGYRDEYLKNHLMQRDLEGGLNKKLGVEKKVLGGETDKELFEGNIDEVLGERMKRIEYFIARKQYSTSGEIDWKKLEEEKDYKSELNPNAEKITEEEKKRRGGFLERMEKVYGKFERDGVVAMKESQYFQELQRWVGEILENSEYGIDTERTHDLILPRGVYEKFKKIKEKGTHVYDYGSPSDEKTTKIFEESILVAVKDLRKLKFLKYFDGNSYLNREGKGLTPEGGVNPNVAYGYPVSLEATMLLIADNWHGAEEKWGTGEEHELIDASGKFHPENFQLWMRYRMWRLSDMNSVKKIAPLDQINFKAGFSQLTLDNILNIPQYMSHQDFEMSGDASRLYDSEKGGTEKRGVQGDPFVNGWGQSKDHQDMTWDNRESMIIEAWRRGFNQEDWATFHLPHVRAELKKWIEAQNQIATENNLLRDWHFWQDFKLPSSKEGEFGKYYKDGKQGSLGKGVLDMLMFYRHFTEFTEFYTEKEDGKAVKVRDFEKNKAYKTLGYDGSSAFLLSIAENSLIWTDPNARMKSEELYKDFIKKQMDEIGAKYQGKVRGENNYKMDNLIANYKRDVEKKEDIKISFDNFDKLVELKMKIETMVMGKTVVKEKEKKENGLSEDKVVTKEEMEREVRGQMRGNIKDFLNKLMEVEIPVVEEDEEGKKIKRDVKIGDRVVFVDEYDRIVTAEECMQICKVDKEEKIKDENKKTVRKIVEEFGASFVKDEIDLGTIKEYEKALRAVKDAEGEYRQASREGDQKKLDKINEKLVEKRAELTKSENVYKSYKEDKVYDDIFKRHERMGLAMLTKVANVSRKQMNIFSETKSQQEVHGNTTSGEFLKEALKKSAATIYDLNDIEAKYAYQTVWYVLPQMRINAWNNTSGVLGGIEPGTALVRTGRAREAQLGLSTGGGSSETKSDYKALSPPTLLDAIPVKRAGEGVARNTILGIMEGNNPDEGGCEIKDRWDRELGKTKSYLIKKDAQSAEYVDHLSSGFEVWKLLVEEEPELKHFHEIVTINAWGVMKVDHEKARKLFDAWWNRCRLTYNSSEIDYDRKISVDGREVTMREHMLGKDIRETQEIIRDHYLELAGKKGKDAKVYDKMAENIMNKPALAAMMNMVTAGIHEHMTFDSHYDMWSTQHVQEIQFIMEHYLHEKGGIELGGEGGNEHIHEKTPTMMPYELFNKLLGVKEGDSMDKYMFWDLFKCLLAGFLAGIGEAQKEMEDELTGQMKKQWIG